MDQGTLPLENYLVWPEQPKDLKPNKTPEKKREIRVECFFKKELCYFVGSCINIGSCTLKLISEN